MGAAVVWALSRCMRIYINEPTKCLKIRDFRFWHRSKLSITSTSSEKRQRPQPVSSAHSRKSGKGKRPTIWLRRFNWRIAKTKPLYAWICCAFYGGGWCSTAGREARPALIRLARRSRDKSDQRASHLLPRAEEGTDWLAHHIGPGTEHAMEIGATGQWCGGRHRGPQLGQVVFLGLAAEDAIPDAIGYPEDLVRRFQVMYEVARPHPILEGANRPRKMDPIMEQLVGNKSRDQPEPYRGRRRHSKDAEDQRR